MCRKFAFGRDKRCGRLPVICCVLVSALAAHGATPSIELTDVPDYGSGKYLSGRVSGVSPSGYAVAVYINVPPYGWWTKPYFASPLTTIRADRTWSCMVNSGGQDPYATELIAFLVPKTYSPPTAGGVQCLAAALYAYPYARAVRYPTIEFGNCEWLIKRAHDPVGPGPNYFSSAKNMVFVDRNGFLHLKIMQQNGQWSCSEVIANRNLGYGRYAFTIAGGAARLNPNVVLGLFTWEDCVPEYNYREIDVELSRWADPCSPNAQYVVQPWNTPGNRHRFELDPSGDPNQFTTHEFTWEPNEITFHSYHGRFALRPSAGDVFEHLSYTGADIPLAGKENLRMNLWLINGQTPTDGLDAEAVIVGVMYLPNEPNNVYRLWSPVLSRHFYTTSPTERDDWIGNPPGEWVYEGIAYCALAMGDRAGLSPVYRLWSESRGEHFYTISEQEKDTMTNDPADKWQLQGVAFHAYPQGTQPPGSRPVYRLVSRTNGCHFYTISPAERDYLIENFSAVWTYEGIVWHAYISGM